MRMKFFSIRSTQTDLVFMRFPAVDWIDSIHKEWPMLELSRKSQKGSQQF